MLPDDKSNMTSGLGQIYGTGFVYLPGLIGCMVGTVLLTKLSSLLAPFSLYFTFTDLVKSGEGGYGILPFFVKMVIPFTVGIAFFARMKTRDAALGVGDVDRRINLELTASSGAALGALMLSWPAIVLWEFVVSSSIYSYRAQFVLVYILYVISFAYVACAGVISARLMWVQNDSRAELKEKLKSQYQLVLVVWTLIFAAATGGLADWASKHLSGAS